MEYQWFFFFTKIINANIHRYTATILSWAEENNFPILDLCTKIIRNRYSLEVVNMWKVCLFMMPLLLFISFDTLAAKTVEVWSYYTAPPFSISNDKRHDLTTILFQELTVRSKGKWIFKPKHLPRKRINFNLKNGVQGIVVWVNPLWFGDKEKKKYDWTHRVVWGANEIVSLKSDPIDYKGPQSLFGKRFGGVRGHRYIGIDDYVKSQKIVRTDTSSFSQNLTKLLNHRLDVIIVSKADLAYMFTQQDIKNKVYISPTPHQTYPRQFLVTKGLEGVKDYINAQLNIIKNEDVDVLLERYGLER